MVICDIVGDGGGGVIAPQLQEFAAAAAVDTAAIDNFSTATVVTVH